jgi:hypothetical protein
MLMAQLLLAYHLKHENKMGHLSVIVPNKDPDLFMPSYNVKIHE